MTEYEGSIPGQEAMAMLDDGNASEGGTVMYYGSPSETSIKYNNERKKIFGFIGKAYIETPQIIDDKKIRRRDDDYARGAELTDEHIAALKAGKLLRFELDDGAVALRYKKGE